jgi:hypothetical protein
VGSTPIILWYFSFPVLGFELRAYTLSHSTSLFFVMGFFEIGSQELFRVLRTIFLGWFRTEIFLISASLVARITGHQCLTNSIHLVTILDSGIKQCD